MSSSRPSVAVIGAGVAGAAAARALGAAGLSVQVFDKSRGAGGRLATRRVETVGADGRVVSTGLDHGAVGFDALSPAFQAFAESAVRIGCLAPWTPRLSPDSLPIERHATLYVPTPDMPALCRYLLRGLPLNLGFTVDALQRGPRGWQLQSAGAQHAGTFDAVVVALPPAQASALINPHRLDWARHASTALMQPCWTLMGIADAPEIDRPWDLARPSSGLLAWVLRNDSRPGRTSASGQAQWVAHARAGWTRQHLEQPAPWVQQHMQAALALCVGKPMHWLHCTVHRWRYALPVAHATAPAASFWWDAAQGLGVCGDFLGGNGVEGAWLSAQALSSALTAALQCRASVTGAGLAVQTCAEAAGTTAAKLIHEDNLQAKECAVTEGPSKTRPAWSAGPQSLPTAPPALA